MGRGGWPVSRRERRRKKLFVFMAFVIFFVLLAIRGSRDEDSIPMPSHGYQPEVESMDEVHRAGEEPETEEAKPAVFYYNRARSLAEDGNLDGAIEGYIRAGEKDPALADAINPELSLLYFERGNKLFEAGKYREAEEDYAASIKLDPEPEEPRFYFNRGVSFYREDDLKNAVASYTMAISIDPDYAFAYLNRGVAYRSKNELETAVRDYTKALESAPEYALAYFNRGEAHGTMGDYAAALSDFEMYLELDPENPRADEVRALVTDIRRRIVR